VLIAIVAGILFLVFDAIRSFAQQLGPVRLRRITGDTESEKHGSWGQYDPDNIQLISGAMLQVALIVALGATMLIFDGLLVGRPFLYAALIWIGIAVSWKFVLVFAPDNAAEAVLKALVPMSHFFYYLFWPIFAPLRSLQDRMDRGEEAAFDAEDVTDEEVQAFIDVGEEEGILEASERQLFHQVVDFGDRVARELMTPRIDVLAFDAGKPIEELARAFSESKYSRIPIYQESIDQITGIVHVKEILDAVLRQDKKSAAEIARPPYFVSETKKVSELLREFQSEHIQVAVVVDEYGGTAGLITIEDIIEEIVGEIADEHEDEEATVVDLGDDTWLVSGLLRVDALKEMLDVDLSGDDYETVAGMIFTMLGRVPAVGTSITKNGFKFLVERADRRRIYRVRVSKDPEWRSDEEEEE
jgi:CBS domain containing-hemolysin-like protein